MFKKSGENFQENKKEDNSWQNLADETLSFEQRQSRERQKRKIISTFKNHDIQTILQRDVVVSENEKKDILEDLASGRISKEAEADFLGKIQGPIDIPSMGRGYSRVYEKIQEDPLQSELFNCLVQQENSINYEQNEEALRELTNNSGFYGRNNTPVGLDPTCDIILKQLRPEMSETEYRQYAEAKNRLMKNIYGKRWEYYQAFEELREEANEMDFSKVQTPSPEALTNSEENFGEVFRVQPERSKTLLENAIFEGDPWEQDGRQYQLGPQILKEEELLPEYGTKVDGKKFYFSKTYQQGGHVAVMGYVPTDEGVKLRSYYKSRSQGVWRYMIDYVKEPEQDRINYIGKGFYEEQYNLPFELQMALGTIEKHGGVKKLTTNPDFIFAGTAKSHISKGQYREKLHSSNPDGDFFQEVSRRATLTELERYLPIQQQDEYGKGYLKLHRPENINLSEEIMPNFSRALASFESESSLVGRVQNEVFESQDGKQRWLMCKDDQGRAWVGGIESKSPITSIGVRRDWIMAGDVSIPLYEYASQDGGYGDRGDARGKYLCMWKHYLNKIPLIKKYVEHSAERNSF